MYAYTGLGEMFETDGLLAILERDPNGPDGKARLVYAEREVDLECTCNAAADALKEALGVTKAEARPKKEVAAYEFMRDAGPLAAAREAMEEVASGWRAAESEIGSNRTTASTVEWLGGMVNRCEEVCRMIDILIGPKKREA